MLQGLAATGPEQRYVAADLLLDKIEARAKMADDQEQDDIAKGLAQIVASYATDVNRNEQRRDVRARMFAIFKKYQRAEMVVYFSKNAFAGDDLTWFDFSNLDTSYQFNFNDTFLLGTDFSGADLESSTFHDSRMRSADFDSTDITNVDFGGADWFNATGLKLTQKTIDQLKAIEPCPKDLDGFIAAHDRRYALLFVDLADETQERLQADWKRYLSPGGACDLIRKKH
jgi:hypothetical protein